DVGSSIDVQLPSAEGRIGRIQQGLGAVAAVRVPQREPVPVAEGVLRKMPARIGEQQAGVAAVVGDVNADRVGRRAGWADGRGAAATDQDGENGDEDALRSHGWLLRRELMR